MTKDNAVFLGACSLLSPAMLLNLSTPEMRTSIEGALIWANEIYNKQHNGIAAPAENTAAPAELPKTVKAPYFIVEKRRTKGLGIRKWSSSISIDTEFTTEEAADTAIDQHINTHDFNRWRYRVVKKERTVPAQYTVERLNSDDTWSVSVVKELLEKFPSESLALEAIRKHGTRSFTYRVIPA